MKTARWAGILLQALVMGILLFLAIAKLMVIHSGARVFRYEGF